MSELSVNVLAFLSGLASTWHRSDVESSNPSKYQQIDRDWRFPFEGQTTNDASLEIVQDVP